MVNESRQAGGYDAVSNRARQCYLQMQVTARSLDRIDDDSGSDLLAAYERRLAAAMSDELFIQDKLEQFDAGVTNVAKHGVNFVDLNRVGG